MKRSIFALVLTLAAVSATAAPTVTCSVSGATTKEAAQYAVFLAAINADRVAQGLPAYAGFPQHCAGVMLSAFAGWVEQMDQADAARIGAQRVAHGDETATNAQCAAASLANGCTKAQAACSVLGGNATCQ